MNNNKNKKNSIYNNSSNNFSSTNFFNDSDNNSNKNILNYYKEITNISNKLYDKLIEKENILNEKAQLLRTQQEYLNSSSNRNYKN